MIKNILRLLIVLAVFALVAGGIYLLVQNSDTNLLANTQLEEGFHDGSESRPQGGGFDRDQPSSGRGFNHGGESGALSNRSLLELGVSVGKIALITIGVVLAQALFRFFRRRKNSTDTSAA